MYFCYNTGHVIKRYYFFKVTIQHLLKIQQVRWQEVTHSGRRRIYPERRQKRKK